MKALSSTRVLKNVQKHSENTIFCANEQILSFSFFEHRYSFYSRNTMKKAVSIKEIAEALGMSRNTVSKALNGQHVPARTKEAVLRKAQEMHYKSFDSDLLKSRKHRILLLSGKPFHNMNFFLPIVKAIEKCCYDSNYELFEYTYNGKTTFFDTVSQRIDDLNPDGILAIECFDSRFINKLLEKELPVCFLDFPGYAFDPSRPHDLLCCYDEKLVRKYVESLIEEQGAKRFCFVGDYHHCLSFHERYMGMIRGVNLGGIKHTKEDDILYKDAEFDAGSVAAFKERILNLNQLPDCFVCCNDFVARKVATALKELGHRIPEDVMIIGFDDVAEAVEERPYLTTFAVNKTFLGEEAVRLLVSRIEAGNIATRTVMVDCALVERESTLG